MSVDLDFASKRWFSILNPHGQRLAQLAEKLYERESRLQSNYQSYTHVVFPLAKAYEGFLKTYLHAVEILPRPGYNEYKFRIGRALNPDVNDRQKNEWWLYDDLERKCSKEVARTLWTAWLECRNKLFHFYFDDEIPLPLDGARKKLLQMSSAMEQAMECVRTREGIEN